MTRSRLALSAIVLLAILALLGGVALANRTVRNEAKVLIGLEPPPQITPLAVVLPSPRPTLPRPSATPQLTNTPAAPTPAGALLPSPTVLPSPTPAPSATPSPAPVVVGDRIYDAYIPAAVKEGQRYQYTCEFDAAWVILQTFGVDASVDEIIARTPIDDSVEPTYEESSEGFVIRGGDIRRAFSGDYRQSFLARGTGGSIAPVFTSYGLAAEPVGDRAGVEAALRRGALVWIKTTVDFKPWRPATWITPDGSRVPTVLGNDHAVVAIGFNADVVVIRDVLGPTSTNWRRPLEYEVSWETFLRSWGAQGFDGLAVEPPQP